MKAGEITIKGTVIKKIFGEGSKSEHEAIYIDTGENSYKLKRAGANPFFDAVLEDVVSKKISATGTMDGYLFIATKIVELVD